MFVGLHADLRIEMFVVVTTFYTLDGMKSILLLKFVFFRSRLRLSLKNTNLLFYCFILISMGVALRIITYPVPFTQGSLDLCNFSNNFFSKRFVSSLSSPKRRAFLNLLRHDLDRLPDERYIPQSIFSRFFCLRNSDIIKGIANRNVRISAMGWA